MKNQTTGDVRSFVRSTLTPVAIAAILISSFPAAANATEKKLVNDTPIDVKYLGQIETNPLFQIKIDNTKQEELYITLRDESGNVLYTQKFNDKVYSKKFQFSNDDLNSLNVTMTVTSKTDRNPQVLQFSNVVRMVDDVVVTRLR